MIDIGRKTIEKTLLMRDIGRATFIQHLVTLSTSNRLILNQVTAEASSQGRRKNWILCKWGLMQLVLGDINGDIIVISQYSMHASRVAYIRVFLPWLEEFEVTTSAHGVKWKGALGRYILNLCKELNWMQCDQFLRYRIRQFGQLLPKSLTIFQG